MALTTIATNLIPDPRLTSPFDVSENASQSIGSDGRGVYATLTDITRDGWVAPFNGVATPEGGAVGVLLIESIDMLTPFTGSSLTSDTTLVWLRGSVNSYAHAIAVRSTDLGSVRLHLPQNGKQLHVTNVGLFDVNSWAEMQSRGILYFDGGGITEAQADGYTLPPATDSSLGGVIVGDGLSITTDGVLSVLEEDIPVATVDRVGGIRPGLGLRTGADGVTDVKIASNSHIQFNGDGELETYGLDVDFSDYYTKTQTDSMFYTRELADATFQKKDSSGGNQGGGDAGLSAYYQFMQLQHDEKRRVSSKS